MTPPDVNLWDQQEHAEGFLAMGPDWPPHRSEGEATLVEELPSSVQRVLDLGCGDGRLLDAVLAARPGAAGVAVDFSDAMLDRARERFGARPGVEVVVHDLARSLTGASGIEGPFDVVVSGFAIHHLADDRKRALFSEVFGLLRPGGLFANLEHVSAPTPHLHARFRALLGEGRGQDDPSNKCVPVEAQVDWLRRVGFVDVDCLWKWHELALLVATRPDAAGSTIADRLGLP